MVDVEASVVKILGNKHKSKGTSSSSKIIIRDFRIAPLKLNLTIDKVRDSWRSASGPLYIMSHASFALVTHSPPVRLHEPAFDKAPRHKELELTRRRERYPPTALGVILRNLKLFIKDAKVKLDMVHLRWWSGSRPQLVTLLERHYSTELKKKWIVLLASSSILRPDLGGFVSAVMRGEEDMAGREAGWVREGRERRPVVREGALTR